MLETINHQLVAEVSKTTVASIMLLASSPARLKSIVAERSGSDVTVRWSEPPESNVTGYQLYVWDRDGEVEQIKVVENSDAAFAGRTIDLERVSPGATIGIKATVPGSPSAIASWDWARVEVP